jgi:AraC-like DNA-binding protein
MPLLMVKKGQQMTNKKNALFRYDQIERVDFKSAGDDGLDVEVISFADLKKRIPATRLASPLGMNFYHFIGVTEGKCRHTIDFVPYICSEATWILLKPGQVHSFDMQSDWNAVTILFKPEFLLPLLKSRSNTELKIYGELDQLPNLISLNPQEHEACVAGITQIEKDIQLEIDINVRHALLRHQVYAILLRLSIALQNEKKPTETSVTSLQRFTRFRQLVETHFTERHQIADYIDMLGCSAKSLNRATLEVMGLCAKSYLSQRIALEAKRLLAHTDLPIATISIHLGFDETTNFVKFFKREVNCIPSEFRRIHDCR